MRFYFIISLTSSDFITCPKIELKTKQCRCSLKLRRWTCDLTKNVAFCYFTRVNRGVKAYKVNWCMTTKVQIIQRTINGPGASTDNNFHNNITTDEETHKTENKITWIPLEIHCFSSLKSKREWKMKKKINKNDFMLISCQGFARKTVKV